MARNNARRFRDPLQLTATTSGQPPQLFAPTTGPETSPPARVVAPLIRTARPQDLKFLDHLQRKFSNALGFLPSAALEWYVHQQRVGIVMENREPAGYILGRTHYRRYPQLRPITQTAVAMDAQRRHLGMALVERIVKQAIDARQLAVQAVCAEDLESNAFWEALNFTCIGTHAPDNSRGRRLHVWRRATTHQQPEWFFTMPPEPGHRRGPRTGAQLPAIQTPAAKIFSDEEIIELAD